MNIQDAKSQISNFTDNPYLKVAETTAKELIEDDTEKNHSTFGMTLGGMLVNTPIKELQSSLETAQDYYAKDADATLEHLSKTCANAEDSLLMVTSLGDGNLREAAHAITDLREALATIIAEEQDLNEDTWEL